MDEIVDNGELTEREMARVTEYVDYLRDEFEDRLVEKLDSLDSILDRGWVNYFGGAYDDQEGPSLAQVKQASLRNRELSINPHIGGGLELIHSYVWGDDIHYDGVPKDRRGGGRDIKGLIEGEAMQESYFGALARKQRQAAFYYDGIVLYAGNDDDQSIEQISIQNISDDYRNPNKADEIWAYRRTWTEHRLTGNPVPRVEWIFTNRHRDKMPDGATIDYNGKREPIARSKRMFVKKANPIVGWAYGTADVQRGISWAEDYRQAMLHGKQMNQSMASIWATFKNNTEKGAKDKAVKLGGSTVAGKAAQIGKENDVNVLASAGQAYDFAKLLPLLANFAAGIGVSVVALSMNSGNAGGSYGAAKSLERPEMLSTTMRRKYNVELDREILIWLGCDPKKLSVWFDPIIDPTERYRDEQRVEMRLGTGLYKGEDIKRMHALIDGKDPDKVTPVPDGWLIPNNRESVELRQIDPNTNISGDAAGSGDPSNGGSFTPTQGSGAKTVKGGSGDQKSDDIRSNRSAREARIEYLALELNITSGEAEMLVDGLPE